MSVQALPGSQNSTGVVSLDTPAVPELTVSLHLLSLPAALRALEEFVVCIVSELQVYKEICWYSRDLHCPVLSERGVSGLQVVTLLNSPPWQGVRGEAELTEVSSLTVHLLPGGENWSRTEKSTDTLQVLWSVTMSRH